MTRIAGERSSDVPSASFAVTNRSLEINDEGLLLGASSCLAAMEKGRQTLSIDAPRVLALLSITYRRPIDDRVLLHIEAASAHWMRGEKALANLRLAFAGLPPVDDPFDAARLRVAEYCLDEGLSPRVLLSELGLAKNWEDEPRVPKDQGSEGGRWTRGGAFDVAVNDHILDSQKPFKEPVPGDEPEDHYTAHAIEISPFTDLPGPGPGGFVDLFPARRAGVTRTPATLPPPVAKAVRDAVRAVGPGRGPVYGTKVHMELKENIKALNDPDVFAEQSYLHGSPVIHGTPGSVRLDIGLGPVERPITIFDLKTGEAKLRPGRIKELRLHLPYKGKGTSIIEIKP